MNVFILTIFYSALIIVQINSANTITPMDLMDNAQALLNEVKSDSQAALDAASDYLETEGPALLHNHGELAKDVGAEAISQQSKELLARLNDIKDAALEQGLDITSCLGSENLLIDLEEIETENINKCVDAQEDNTLFNFKSAFREVKNTFRAVSDTEEMLNSCQRSDEACIDNVIDWIETNLESIPDLIMQETDMMGFTFEQASSLMGDCYTTYIYDIEDKGDDILEDMQNCIDNL